MSAIIIISIEGVLCPHDEKLPTASPVLSGLRLVQALSLSWQLGYVAAAPRETTLAWLKEVKAPTWCWVAESTACDRASVILRHLGERQDRAQFVFAGDSMGFDVLSQHGATTVLMAHSSTFALGDWKQESNWVDSVDPVEEV